MRIAQIAPLAESVPPKLYGGTERVVAWLVDELVELGHQVTLFASGNSKTRADLVGVWPRALRLGRPRTDPMAAQAMLLELVAQQASKFDVVHCHIDWVQLPLLRRLDVPYLTTFHGRLDLPGLSKVIGQFPGAPFHIDFEQPAFAVASGPLARHGLSRASTSIAAPVVHSRKISCLPGQARF